MYIERIDTNLLKWLLVGSKRDTLPSCNTRLSRASITKVLISLDSLAFRFLLR